jgi:ATP-dependent helicase HepA
MESLATGQRWISESEPELGLGTVIQVGEGRINILFSASGNTRLYSLENAPLKRVRFRRGDTIKSHEGIEFVVSEVKEVHGLLTYIGQGNELAESQLDDSISFHRPEDRLLSGSFDDWNEIRLRRQSLQFMNQMKQSPIRGYLGGRIDLIPHQLSIAHEVSSRIAPRVLLSDEVGLGKTIEAGLILHRMLVMGRASRMLILVPDPLVNQWFVELLRKFNLSFSLFDEERCVSIERTGENPFLDDQWILCSIEFLAGSGHRTAQAVEAGWDVLVVDEAHHLEWSAESASSDYLMVESLSRKTEGLILLTATPEQLGLESHFARLRLLDPDRYQDFDVFLKESEKYQVVARIADRLMEKKKLNPQEREDFVKCFPGLDESNLEVEHLLDLYGPGRVVFRNTRATMKGFPKRIARFCPIRVEKDWEDWMDRLSTEFAVDAGDSKLQTALDFEKDSRVYWLTELLRDLDPKKILLICRSKEKVLALEQALRHQIQVKTAVFHEDLTLLQRDRNAAWFSEEGGARLLLCSEIGSEGRNFQFAHHLVLFDLPLNPELLEQRIGRLDRIDQTEDIKIHLPYVEGSSQEVLVKWYHEGMNAFETNLEGGNELLHRFGTQVHDLALEYPEKPQKEAHLELSELIDKTASLHADQLKKLRLGRDRLLELNSFKPETAQSLVTSIRGEDEKDLLENFLLEVLDHFGVRVEESASRTYQLDGSGVVTDSFPSLPEEGLVATFDRARALSREDVAFFSWDHPIVTGAIELVLTGETGNAGFGIWQDATQRSLLLELFFVLETIITGKWNADRFLPPTPIRIVVDHEFNDLTNTLKESEMWSHLKKASPYKLIDNPEVAGKTLPAMVEAARGFAEKKSKHLIDDCLKNAVPLLQSEVVRLKDLRVVNDHIRLEEIHLAEARQAALVEAVQGARLRLDSVMLIWKGPKEVLG